MTKKEAAALLDKWSAQPRIRRLMPKIVQAVRLLIGKPQLPVGVSAVKIKGWREPD